ncbi:MAG: thioredoxin family protein [candidate division Zixibacteria bacterium]|nr:thioredoxin family protein [candidate division Zixibacteria bacterium]MCI0597396.1 thioredoxin family protein [candidate division Zixibacteria bacterium]
MKLAIVFAAAFLCGASLAFAGEKSKDIAWQDYTEAVAAAKKSNKPVLLDFWRPG